MLFVILCENKGQLPLQKSSITMLNKFSNMFTLFTYSNKNVFYCGYYILYCVYCIHAVHYELCLENGLKKFSLL